MIITAEGHDRNSGYGARPDGYDWVIGHRCGAEIQSFDVSTITAHQRIALAKSLAAIAAEPRAR